MNVKNLDQNMIRIYSRKVRFQVRSNLRRRHHQKFDSKYYFNKINKCAKNLFRFEPLAEESSKAASAAFLR